MGALLDSGLWRSRSALREALKLMWFGRYSRSGGAALDSSGFEHVFVGNETGTGTGAHGDMGTWGQRGTWGHEGIWTHMGMGGTWRHEDTGTHGDSWGHEDIWTHGDTWGQMGT
ncbi:poly(U)-specific endoribonuclease-A-like, partial [Numida meleagris]|uniref:poly(U)-specific endoribonuclease-A-like n=1 Tax=Numida meleagris TaxID=8996 RepID=UPI000B3D962D